MRREYLDRTLGMVLGFLIAVLFLATAFYLVMRGHDGAGASLGISGLVVIVGKLIQGRQASPSAAEIRPPNP
jgi:VIT1/CCC1 family predicted Fe2+/Mn2+ transporter